MNKDIPDELLIHGMVFELPPPTNQVYRAWKSKVYMNKLGTDYIKLVNPQLKYVYPDLKIPPRKPMGIIIEAHMNTLNIHKRDWDGCVKQLQDLIMRHGGGNDAWIMQASVTKHLLAKDEEMEYARVWLFLLPTQIG